VHPQLGNGTEGTSIHQIVEDLLGERIEALAGWIQELDAQVRATSAAGDEKTLKELRRALEAWTKRDPKFEERLTDRVDVLADRLATLSSTVNTTAAAHASSDGDIACLRRELEQETAKLHTAIRDLGSTAAGGELEELRKAIADLSRGGGPRRNGDSGAPDVVEKVANLRERVDMLAKTVATTAAGLAGREGDVAALRKALEEGNERIEQLAAGIRSVSRGGDLAALDSRLNSLAETLTAATTGIAERERGTATLTSRVGEHSAKLDELASAMRQSREALEARLAALDEERHRTEAIPALEGRVSELHRQIAALDTRLAAVDPQFEDLRVRLETLSSTVESTASERMRGEHELADLRQQLAESDARFEAALAEVRASVATWPEGISSTDLDTRLAPLHDRLKVVASGLEEADNRVAALIARESTKTAALEREVEQTRTQLIELEGKSASFAAAGANTEAAWEAERAWVREQLDALVTTVADTAARADVEPLVGDVATRVQELETEQAALTAEIARTRETFLAEKERLEAELRELPRPAAPIPPSEDKQLKHLLTAFADRIDAMEHERAEIAAEAARTASSGLDERLEELATRIRSLEERPTSAAAPAPLPGDGRFRVELRALELRMQHAEAAARENREAVLVQLERLASRIEWRLQRLEADAPAEPEEAHEEQALGKVVPLRGGIET
jgi:chromosome segregation ATPase